MTSPLISIVIPTYNRADLLREALESVYAQTYSNYEVIVVDDGSTDHTDLMLDEYAGRARVLRQSRGGISSARNAGLRACSGDYVAFLDNDDRWTPEKLEHHVAFAATHAECAVTYTDAIQFTESGPNTQTFVQRFPALMEPADLFRRMITEYAIPLMSATMVRLEFLREYGLQFQEYAGIDDLLLFLEILRRGGRFAYLPEPLTWRRMHPGNFSGNHRRRFEQRALMYRMMLKEFQNLSREQRSAVVLGLRDAQFRVGECDWEEMNLVQARREFFQSIGIDKRGCQALVYGLLSFLPSAAIAGIRNLRQL